jgi:hypothetical protein
VDHLSLAGMPSSYVAFAEHDAAEQVRRLEPVVLARLREAGNPAPKPTPICPSGPRVYVEQLLAFG